jgi:alpha-tubulin suppressor-like RCC1 family protein
MSQIMEKFDVLNELNDEFKQRVKILYVFENYELIQNVLNNVLIVTKDDKTFAFGINDNGLLGFGHDKVVNETQIVEELCDQQIVDFANSKYHCIARNSRGKVYCWGCNEYLGIGSQDDKYPKPKLNEYLNNEFVVDISCGERHSLVLTNCGEVFAWGGNDQGQIGNGWIDIQLIPIKVKGFDNEKVVMISCGSKHSMALTECGHVYSWGGNVSGQLGIGNTGHSNEPKFVAVIDENKCNVFIKKISCGLEHSLLLSTDGNIYAFGCNNFGQLGNQKEGNGVYAYIFPRIQWEVSPQRIKIETKFIDISSHWRESISIALSQDGIYFNWGKCGEEIIRTPKPTSFESFVEIYAKYYKISNKAINFEEQNSVQIPDSGPIKLQNKYAKEFSEQSLISFGGFGFVSKVVNKNSGKIYAIKRIALNELESEKAFKELNLMKELKSCYVVEHIDSWIEKNTLKYEKYSGTGSSSKSLELHPVFDLRKPILLHIQMELCSQTLTEVMKYLSKLFSENNSKITKTWSYFISCESLTEIIECVHFLHERKVIHRDLKPANILITEGINGRFVKLADFGLSVIHEFIDQSHTKFSGTFDYMAPEVMRTKKYDTKADIYSLGIIVEELFTFNNNSYANSYLKTFYWMSLFLRIFNYN